MVLLLNPKSQKFNKLEEKSSQEIGAFNKNVITKLRESQGGGLEKEAGRTNKV
ncbi:hypothetical protein HanLR1_Chr12g0445991 [Helianthus annuus]|nr:hypothetical protein HanHA89_Chr12g0468981 [Helianthus annuus]KAJ0674974.1 hypothetical protein HanLR1_Chr12g0445991 [Helianthus annuus]